MCISSHLYSLCTFPQSLERIEIENKVDGIVQVKASGNYHNSDNE